MVHPGNGQDHPHRLEENKMSLDFSTQIEDVKQRLIAVVPNARVVKNFGDAPKIGGIVQPHIVLQFGGPVRAARGRGIVGSAKDPHLLWCHVHCVAITDEDSQSLLDDVLGALVDFYPTGSGPMTLGGGLSVPINSTDTLPVRIDKVARFTFTYNL